MSLIVQKFGGSSVADADRIRNVARIITRTYQQGHSVVVVLSAQGDTTDDLIEKAREINPHASKREMDMLLSTGEQISISLCAMCIEGMGYQAVSLTGWQVGMLTDSVYSNARIKRIRTERIQKELDKKKIVLGQPAAGLVPGGNMNAELLIALMSLAGTVVGSLSGVLAANRLTNYRIQELEKKVEKHNTVLERTFRLEERMKVANNRIQDLERHEEQEWAQHRQTPLR